MNRGNDTIRVLIPLKVRKKNGRPKIMPPADYSPSEDQTQGLSLDPSNRWLWRFSRQPLDSHTEWRHSVANGVLQQVPQDHV